MKKYLALDIGNVLVNQDMESFIKPLSKQMNLSKQDAWHFINRIQHKQDIGVTSVRDELSTHFGIKSEYILEELIGAWHQVCKPNKSSIKGLEDLAWKHDCDVVLVSNLGFEHAEHFSSALSESPLYKDSIHHFSCKIGVRKPTPTYYKLLIDFHPEFKECVYVDDLAENLQAGEDMGLRSFHYDLSKYDEAQMQHRLMELDEFLKN